MILSELLPRLNWVRKGGSGFVARCPAHDDKKPSLSLHEDVGRILLFCHAGCTTDEILKSLGLTFSDLYDKRITEPSRRSLGEAVFKGYRDQANGVAYF